MSHSKKWTQNREVKNQIWAREAEFQHLKRVVAALLCQIVATCARGWPQVDASGNIWVAGSSDSSGTDMLLMKFNSDGVHQSTILHGGTGGEIAHGLEAIRAHLAVMYLPSAGGHADGSRILQLSGLARHIGF